MNRFLKAKSQKKTKKILSRVWAFAPESAEQDEKPKAFIDSLDGKMSVAPDGKEKSKSSALISYDREDEDEEK